MNIEWGTMIYSLFIFGFLLFIFGLVVYFIVKLATSNKKSSSQFEELNKKMDKLIELQDKNNY